MKDLVETVVKNNNCVGCGLCSKLYQNCYGMQISEDGYYRPKKFRDNHNSELNEKFKQLCPGMVRREKLKSDNEIGIWGKYEKVCTTYASNEDIRYKASTGGSLTAILVYLLENNIVDGVLQVRTNEKVPYISQYEISKSVEDVINSIGSRYEPTSIFSKLNEVKNFEGMLAIVGKPCDIASFKRYIQKYDLEEKIYCYISFLCGGTPSINATLDILKENNVDKSEITELKYRGEGWPGYFKVKKEEEEVIKISYTESWAQKLSKKVQQSCRICTDGIGEMADIVFGDAWNLNENGKIDFSESDGLNITLVRSKIGKDIIDNAIKKDYIKIDTEHLDENTLNKMQPFQAMHRKQVYYKILGKKLSMKNVPYFPKKLFKNFSKNQSIVKRIKLILSSVMKEIKGV